jgi:uncharacterized paraquat-inducible protein A
MGRRYVLVAVLLAVPVLEVPVLVLVPVTRVTLGEMVLVRREEVPAGMVRELKREFVAEAVAPVGVATVYVESITKYAE